MNGINLYNREEDNFIRIKNLDAMTIDIDQDTKGNLWFPHKEKGLFQISSGKTNMENYVHNNTLPNTLANLSKLLPDRQPWRDMGRNHERTL